MNQDLPHDEMLMKHIAGLLDPAEESAFRQSIEQDENTFIEVQALKQTLQRLEGLPEFQPPQVALDAVKAAAFRPIMLRRRFTLLAVAASVILLLASLALLRQQTGPSQPEVPSAEQLNQPDSDSDGARLPAWTDRNRMVTIDTVPPADSIPPGAKLKPVDPVDDKGRSNRSVTLTRSN